MTGLKIILKGGSWLTVALPEPEADGLLSSFTTRQMALGDRRAVAGTHMLSIGPDGSASVLQAAWSVLADEIVSIHALPLFQPQSAQPPKPASAAYNPFAPRVG